jgi:hypothetical protein
MNTREKSFKSEKNIRGKAAFNWNIAVTTTMR